MKLSNRPSRRGIQSGTKRSRARGGGSVAGIELESRADAPGARAYDVFVKCFEAGVLVRYTGDILAFSPPLIVDERQIDQIFSTVGDALRQVG